MKRPFLSAFLLFAVAMPVAAQQYKDNEDTPKDTVIKRDETVKPEGRYANMPDEAVPYRRFTKPYYDWFVQRRHARIPWRGGPAAGRRPRSLEGHRHWFLRPGGKQS